MKSTRDIGRDTLTRVGAQYEGSLFTPSHVKSEMRTVDNTLTTMVKDLLTDESVPQSVKSAFAQFVAEWRKFHEAHKGVVARSLNTTYGTVQEYRRRVRDWQQKLAAEGHKGSTPILPKEVKRGIAGWVGPALALGAGVGVLYWLFQRKD